VDAVRQELNDLILQLRPAGLEDRGLGDALHSYAREWERRHDIDVRVRVAGESPLPADVEDCLFRIAQEALWNAARHSEAESVEVSLGGSGEAVVMSITDDGLGFDPGMPTGGLGLRSMRERARSIGGELAVQSAPGEGTRLTVTCPLSGTAQPSQLAGGGQDG
jgi:signal transduction histidine kinase